MNIRRHFLPALFFLVTLLSISPKNSFSQTEKVTPSFKGKWISSITFVGNKNVTDGELLDIFQFEDDIAGKVNRLFTRQFDQSEIDFSLKYRIREFLSTRGYVNAAVGDVTYLVWGGSVQIVVPISEGKLHRFGDIAIKGARAFTTQEVIQFLGFKGGDVFNRLVFQRMVFAELPKLYGSKGYAECSVDEENVTLRPNPDGSNDVMVDFELVIDEGRRFLVESVDFVGDADPNDVRSLLTFKTGDMFDVSKLDESIKRINDSGQYEEVRFDQDVEIRNTYATDFGEPNPMPLVSRSPNVDMSFGKTTISIIVKKLKPARAYRIGSVKFVGNKTIGESELKKALGLDNPSYFDVRLFIDKTREFNQSGRARPITEHDIDLEIGEKGRDDDELADQIHITIRIRELPKKSSHPR